MRKRIFWIYTAFMLAMAAAIVWRYPTGDIYLFLNGISQQNDQQPAYVALLLAGGGILLSFLLSCIRADALIKSDGGLRIGSLFFPVGSFPAGRERILAAIDRFFTTLTICVDILFLYQMSCVLLQRMWLHAWIGWGMLAVIVIALLGMLWQIGSIKTKRV